MREDDVGAQPRARVRFPVMGYLTHGEVIAMGGKPSKGTKKDKRLKGNKKEKKK